MRAAQDGNDGLVKGRGASSNPTSRFDQLAYTPDPGEGPSSLPTELFKDVSKSIFSENDSPDIELRRGLNIYRGCEHGCVYCYARPTHEYLGLSSGLDFESKLFVKEKAPELLRETLMKPAYRPVPLAFSGATDPYQPVEKQLRLTRRCLKILTEFRHPVCMITKSSMIERDIDLLQDLAGDDCAWATISLTTLDATLQRKLEPRASTPRARLDVIQKLSDAGVPVGVNVSPVIPGLTEHEIPAILKAVSDSGARRATWVILRLPYSVKDLFQDWLGYHEPLKKDKVLSKLKALHGGKLYDSTFGTRVRGQGILSEQIEQMFRVNCKRHGLNMEPMDFNLSAFKRPYGQMELF